MRPGCLWDQCQPLTGGRLIGGAHFTGRRAGGGQASRELLGGSMWPGGGSTLCRCLAHRSWVTDNAVLSVGSVCGDARLRLQAEGLLKIHFSGKSLSAVWRMDWERLFLSGSRAWVVSALPAVQSLPLALPGTHRSGPAAPAPASPADLGPPGPSTGARNVRREALDSSGWSGPSPTASDLAAAALGHVYSLHVGRRRPRGVRSLV